MFPFDRSASGQPVSLIGKPVINMATPFRLIYEKDVEQSSYECEFGISCYPVSSKEKTRRKQNLILI